MKNKFQYFSITISCISIIVTGIFGLLLLNEKNNIRILSKQYLDLNTNKDVENVKDGINGEDGKDGADGKDGVDGKDGADGKDGTNGKDGKTPELKQNNGELQWKYKEDDTWNTLIKLDEISTVKGIAKFTTRLKDKNSGYVNFDGITPIITGNKFANSDGEKIKLTSGHYYYASLNYTSSGPSSGHFVAYLYDGDKKIATAYNYQDATSSTPTAFTSTIFLSTGNDFKVYAKSCGTGCVIDVEVTIVDLGKK